MVTAPTSGVVGTIDFKEGALVSPQTLLTVLSNNGDVQAYFSLNEKEIYALTDNGKKSMKEALAQLPPVTLYACKRRTVRTRRKDNIGLRSRSTPPLEARQQRLFSQILAAHFAAAIRPT